MVDRDAPSTSPLDCATPAIPQFPPRPIVGSFVAILGVGVTLLGIVLLLPLALYFIELISNARFHADAYGVFVVIAMFLIGALFIYFGINWFKEAIGIITGKRRFMAVPSPAKSNAPRRRGS